MADPMADPPQSLALAVDPGLAKWGLAVVAPDGRCLAREVVLQTDAPERASSYAQTYQVTVLLLGDRTGSSDAEARLRERLPNHPLERAPEHGTTLLARALYWRDHPPRGWRRLMPRGLLTPPGPLDAYAAEALALRHFGLLTETLPGESKNRSPRR